MVILDEATQAVEPASLIPIIHSATKFVLIGDQKPLGPTITGDASNEMKNCGYGKSLFQRLVANEMDFVLLDKQYRMHPAISDFPNRCFYEGQLSNGVDAGDRLSPSLGFPTPLLFLDVDGNEVPHGTSFANEEEGAAVRLVVTRMREHGVEDK
jgi:regulator of nonsense transcripts 1